MSTPFDSGDTRPGLAHLWVGHHARMEEPTCPDFTPTLRALLPTGTRVIPARTLNDLPSALLIPLCRTLRQSGATPVQSSPDAPLLP